MHGKLHSKQFLCLPTTVLHICCRTVRPLVQILNRKFVVQVEVVVFLFFSPFPRPLPLDYRGVGLAGGVRCIVRPWRVGFCSNCYRLERSFNIYSLLRVNLIYIYIYMYIASYSAVYFYVLSCLQVFCQFDLTLLPHAIVCVINVFTFKLLYD